MRSPRPHLLALLVPAALAACTTVGPDYRRPDGTIPVAWQSPSPWREAKPQDALSRDGWWRMFGDASLDALEAQALAGSPRLEAMAARVAQVRALAGVAEAEASVRVDAEVDAGAQRFSGNRPDQPGKEVVAYRTNRFLTPVVASYELDLWGRVRRLREAAKARVEGAEAAQAAARLALTAEVAHAWFMVQAVDRDRDLIREGITVRRRARELVAKRVAGGVATPADLARVDSEIATLQSDEVAAGAMRTNLVHALAVLVGAAPEQFALPASAAVAVPPAVPLGTPSDLLERRPDVAEAERDLAARNADIGVARAAWYPTVRLIGGAGLEATSAGDLVRSESVFWSLFPSLQVPLVDGGRRDAQLARVQAAYRENAALYRGRLLQAFREVEDALTTLRALDERAGHAATAVTEAERALRISEARYRGGLATYLEVADGQRLVLGARRGEAQVRAERFAATVALVRALGGGWSATDPSATAAGPAAAKS